MAPHDDVYLYKYKKLLWDQVTFVVHLMQSSHLYKV